MAGNFEDLPYVGDFGRQLLACATLEEAQALIGSGGGETPATTVDTLGGATDTGKKIMKAADGAAVRTLINARAAGNVPWNEIDNKPTIPAAATAATTSKAGLVKQATIADNADNAAIIAALKAANIAVSPASGDQSQTDQPGF